MAKMKGLDFKALLLNHGEKLGAGIVALLGLTGLATASWSTCKLDPLQLKADADKTKTQWLASNWPEENRVAFASTPAVEENAKKMVESNEEAGKFATSRRWNEPISKSREKLESIAVLAPQVPEASLVIFPLVERDDEQETKDAEKEPEKKAPGKKGKKEENTKDLEELFGSTTPQNAVGAGDIGSGLDNGPGGLAGTGGLAGPGGLAGGLGAPGGLTGGLAGPGGKSGPGGMAGPGGLPGGRSSPAGRGRGGMSGSSGRGGAPGMAGMAGMAGMGGVGGKGSMGGLGESDGTLGGMGLGSLDGYGGADLGVVETKKVRSHAGVSVRYIFDMYKQAQQLAEALSLSGGDARNYIDFVNLQIERKRSIPGADPWAGEWEALSLDSIGEILETSLAFDIDIVNPSVVRTEITMPLPRRAAGRWTPADASHKLLEDFQLSEDEQKIINRLNEKLREEADKLKAQLPPEQARSEGFRRFSFDNNDLFSGLNNAGFGGSESSGMLDDLYTEMGNNKKDGEQNEKDAKKSREDFDKQLRNSMVAGRLLLVRFMDFTCDRGTAYRYRVRLEMRNPNFNRPIDELVDPETASQKTVFSEWSEQTEPVFVPNGYRYYVDKVESRPRADEYAALSLYYEHETAGTPVMSTIRVPVGTRIGGRQSVDVVDLGKNSLEITEIDLKSQDYLASVTEAPKIVKNDFPELKSLFESLGAARPVGDRITVVDSNGAIVSRFVGDSVSTGNRDISRSDDVRLASFVLKTYEHLRPSAEGESTSPYSEGDLGSKGGDMTGGGGPGMLGSGSGMNFSGGMGQGSALSGSGGGAGGGAGRRGGGRQRGSAGGMR